MMHDLLATAAARSPSAPAVRDAEGGWSYRQLDEHSRRFAAWLGRIGVSAGDRVVVQHGRDRRIVAMLHGTSYAGGVFVPVNPAAGDLWLPTVVADAEPAVVLTTDAGATALAGRGGATVMTATDAWRQALDTPALPVGASVPGADQDGLALLMYTSGSTAAPKGVMCAHRQVVFATGAIGQRLGYTADDRVLCALPMSFDYGLYQALLCALGGSELQLAPEGREVELLRRIRDWQSSVVPVVPSLATMIVNLARRRPDRTTPVRLLTNTGEALGPGLVRDLRASFPGAQVCLMFGVTECKRISILEPDGDRARPGSVGRPLAGTEVLVTDPDGRPLPPGEVGEFVVRGPHLAAGYWRAPELTARRFPPGPDQAPELHTGDFGYADPDGYLYFVGRRDDIFKRRGVRMSVTEIEAAAGTIDGVTGAGLVRPDGRYDLTLFVTGSRSPAEVLRELRRLLEPAKTPAVCRRLAELPLTANGKVDRRALAALREPATAPGPAAA
ncbi:class I adenylate-forming enzyme family protein [Plantactinospora sp. CA-294935]|uniref:class I adenylate-forming enzyme family protein n=1 Tax=Plantactinospora sp. CA-294935 TaxID=3240012 RepID=UPI003D8D9761